MIVQCEKCKSKFNVNPALLKPTGTVVRCSICKNIFVVHPEEEIQKAAPESLFEEEPKKDLPFERLFEEEKPTKEEKPTPEEVFKEEEEGFRDLFGEDAEKTEVSEPREKEEAEPRVEPPKKKRGSLIWIVIVSVVLLLLAGLAYFITKLPGNLLENVSGLFAQKAGKEQQADPGNKKLSIFGVTGKFVKTEKGSLFVITGNVRNRYGDKRKDILVRANVLDNKGNILKQETAFAGVILSDQEISKGNIETIVQKLKDRGEIESKNIVVNPGDTLSFMIIFSDLPQNVSEFTVQALESKPLMTSK